MHCRVGAETQRVCRQVLSFSGEDETGGGAGGQRAVWVTYWRLTLYTLDSLPPLGVSQPSDDDQHHLCMMRMDLNSRLDPFIDVLIDVLFITVLKKTRAVFNDLLTTVINSMWCGGGGGGGVIGNHTRSEAQKLHEKGCFSRRS